MKEIVLQPVLLERMKQVYEEMHEGYEQVALKLKFGCDGCPDNCCDSYFQHHTYIEWGYLWEGFRQLDDEKKKTILDRCQNVLAHYETKISRNERPQIMCPLNEDGLCLLYAYRLMVCRTHGVPATMVRPDGKRIDFPGCFRCQELVSKSYPSTDGLPRMERTPMLQKLALLENELMDGKRAMYPRLQLTIAQMLIKGPPVVEEPFCEREKKG